MFSRQLQPLLTEPTAVFRTQPVLLRIICRYARYQHPSSRRTRVDPAIPPPPPPHRKSIRKQRIPEKPPIWTHSVLEYARIRNNSIFRHSGPFSTSHAVRVYPVETRTQTMDLGAKRTQDRATSRQDDPGNARAGDGG